MPLKVKREAAGRTSCGEVCTYHVDDVGGVDGWELRRRKVSAFVVFCGGDV